MDSEINNNLNLIEDTENITEKSEEPLKKEKKRSKKEKRVKKENSKASYSRSSERQKTRAMVTAIMVVGVCLFAVSIIGLAGAVSELNKQSVNEQDNIVDSNVNNNMNIPIYNASAENESKAPVDTVPETTAASVDNADIPSSVPQTDAEWLSFFNSSVNKLKTGGCSFTKSKQTVTRDIALSNKLAQTYVSAVKDKFLSDETVKTDIAKGDTSSALKNVSPEGVNYVSALSTGDIKSISHSTNGSGNYVVRIDMNDMTNPEKAGAYGKIFDFMLVDDVEKTYAPDIGATVARENILLEFKNCYAEAEIKPDGTLVKFATYVNANMILKNAKISVVTTDLNALLESNTVYDNIVW